MYIALHTEDILVLPSRLFFPKVKRVSRKNEVTCQKFYIYSFDAMV